MPALDRNLPMKCTKCEKMVVKKHMARHKQSCDSMTLSCPKCSNFFTKKKEDLNYHLAKHHAPKDVKLSTVCTVCLEEFPSFYSLQQHKRRKHGTLTKVGTKSSEKLKEVLESEELDQNSEQLQQELSAVLASTYLMIRKWRMGDIECLTSSCPSSIPMRSTRN